MSMHCHLETHYFICSLENRRRRKGRMERKGEEERDEEEEEEGRNSKP